MQTLETALKSLWGASRMPFGKAPATLHRWEAFQQAEAQLLRRLSVRAWGIVHGPNGVGKSQLAAAVADALPDKQYRVARLTHSTLGASDLLRALGHTLEVKPAFRRADTVAALIRHWQQLDRIHPIILVDEAQNLSSCALEELRLLSCIGLDPRPVFSLVLIGDQQLLPRLQMGVQYALRHRLGFQIQLRPMTPAQSREYVEARLAEVGMRTGPFEDQALELLVQAAGGIARSLNHLAQRSMELAIARSTQRVLTADVQAAIEQLPWLTPEST